MLTWNDVIKLAVPILGSVLLLVLKQWYERRSERRAKEESLWRGIDQESTYFRRALEAVDVVARAFNSGSMALVQIDIPKTLTDLAARLAELDGKHSYIYSAYASDAELVRNGLAYYRDLTKSHVMADGASQARIAQAIGAQAFALKGDLLKLARSELAVLELIQRSNPKKDPQTITRVRSSIEGSLDLVSIRVEYLKAEVSDSPRTPVSPELRIPN
jgi:hypothetical protein